MGLFDLPWKFIVRLFEGASGVVRWLAGNTIRMVFLLGILVVIPLSITIVGFLLSGTESSRGAAWREYFQVREEVISGREDADWLEDLVLLGPQGDFLGNSLRASTVPKLWALQFAADMELRDGARLVYSNRDLAEDRLTHAIDLYDRIAKSSSGIGGLLHERVLLGKAHAHEILLSCSKNVSEFNRHYTQAVTTLLELVAFGTNPSIKANAERRKEMLQKFGSDTWTEGDTSPSSFYSWLSNYEAPEPLPDLFPSNPSALDPRPPISPFPDPGEVLPPPVLAPPAVDTVDPPANTEGGDDSPGDEKPEEGDNPGDEKPEEGDNPGDEKPEEGDNPGDEKPEEGDNPGDEKPEEE
jgi:hypothetical protein